MKRLLLVALLFPMLSWAQTPWRYVQTVLAPTETWTDPQVSAGTYCYRVSASEANRANESPWSNSAEVTSTGTKDNVVTWDYPVNPIAVGVVEYHIQRKDGPCVPITIHLAPTNTQVQ